MTDILANGTRVTLTEDVPGIPAGSTGTVHGSWATHTGVIFDTNPGYIRYIPANQLNAHHDVEDVTRAAEAAILHIIENAYADTYPCNNPQGCERTAHWWWECTCGTIRYGCNPCKTAYDHYQATTEHRLCNNCHTLIPNPLPWKALR